MTDYTNAPATELVATRCAVCARELVDADSVETGVGPVCRKKYGYDSPSLFPQWDAVRAALGEEEYEALGIDKRRPLYNDSEVARWVANKLVYRVAAEQTGPRVTARTAALAALGYDALATCIANRLGAIRVAVEGDLFVVEAPKSETFTSAMRRVPGSRWVAARRARLVPASSKGPLWKAIKAAFPGSLVIGSRWAVA